MIMVDSSVWIDYFNGKECPEVVYLDTILGVKPVVIGDNILTEVLQGFKGDKEYKTAKQLLTALPVLQLSNKVLAVKCADNYRALRKRGVTVRKTIDTIIATYCIEQNIKLLFTDRDFLPFVEFLGLKYAI
ncbi:MAG: PIN domain nuclease [Gammaproteobacteria bacterium]|nr:PIN domain nuclease [Gammaproteobacteria bacterium]